MQRYYFYFIMSKMSACVLVLLHIIACPYNKTTIFAVNKRNIDLKLTIPKKRCHI